MFLVYTHPHIVIMLSGILQLACFTELCAQESEDLPILQRTRLSDDSWATSRSSSMGLAVSPIANGMDAFFYNPAGIGGLHYKQKRPLVTQLHFPYFGAAVNNDSLELNQKLREGGDLEDDQVIDSILEKFQNERQYARLSLVPNVVLGRFMLAYVYDQQVAAVSPDGTGDNIDLASREDSGPSLGFSFVSPRRDISMGFSMSYIERTEILGNYSFSELNTPGERKSALKENKAKYQATPIHAGLIWQINKDLRPTLSLAIRHAGGTRYRTKDEDRDNIKTDEDLTLGFGVSPNISSWGYLSAVFEAGRLTQSESNLSKKLRLGLEWTLGNRFGWEAGLSLRAGYNVAGASYGLGFNAGIISLNLASFAEDVGIANEQVIERRNVADFSINVAAF